MGKCRDCKKCKERGIIGLTKKMANTALIVGSLGTSVVGSKVAGSLREKCPECGHPITTHEIVDGRFKD